MEWVCKPNSVPTACAVGGGHSSGTDVAIGLKRPTRGFRKRTTGSAGPAAIRIPARRAAAFPLFGLAPGGVDQAVVSPRRRCALAAPFHPYRGRAEVGSGKPGGWEGQGTLGHSRHFVSRLLPPTSPFRSSTAVCFLLHFPSGRPAFLLGSTLPCGVRTFLRERAGLAQCGQRSGRGDHPTHSIRVM